MPTMKITSDSLTDIADSIRAKLGVDTTYLPSEMAAAIDSITGGVTQEDNGKVVVNGALVAQTATSVDENGTYDTTTNNSVVVDVPNSYTAADEGKVVSSGQLVAQTSLTVSSNGTYDTTTTNSITVSVEGGGGDDAVIPSTYQRLEYVTSSGGTTTSNPKAGSYATHRGPQIASGQYIMAVVTCSSTAEGSLVGISEQSNGSSFECYFSSVSSSTVSGLIQRGYEAVALDVTVSGWTSAANAQVHPIAPIWKATSALRRDFYFCAYRVTTSSSRDYPYIGRIYRIMVGNQLSSVTPGNYTVTGKTHDFVPCKRVADGKVGLYDWINDEFYPSEGGTEFTAGPVVGG